MSTGVRIAPSTFGRVFRRFQRQVELAENSPGPFTDFHSGLAHTMECYKEWLYFEARRRLNAEAWSPEMIGSGKILQHVRDAIEINEGIGRRNNIVEWEGKKRGPGSRSTLKLLAAQQDDRKRAEAEQALWDMYAGHANPQQCFGRLVDLFNPRYDLISYLFFIRDWNEFMPVKSSFFPRVFELLELPHPMVKLCRWDNYTGVLARLREVQRHLAGYNIPNGVRLIDAHTFCWLLEWLEEPLAEEQPPLQILPIIPVAGAAPAGGDGDAGRTQADLEESQRNQKRVGDLAQSIVLKAERQRLEELGRKDLAARVRDVSDNVMLGYDIESYTMQGEMKPIEVKAAAKRQEDLRFFVSRNELLKAEALPNYHFILVCDVQSKQPVLHEFAGNTLPGDALFPVQYEVRLQGTKA